ncbi:hypothetical protein ACU8OG_09595 [Rhizobium leguminosarum]
MALPSFTTTCGFAGSTAARYASQPLLGKLVWQEAPATGVASTNVAPDINDASGAAIFRVRASVDSWLSYGKSPNSAGSVRVAIPANVDCDLYPEVGDKFMWQAA